jgi:DNA-directed RNA polymerase omega subunit
MQKIPESIGSKYRFIILAAERAHQLLHNGAEPKIKTHSTKPAYIAMKELEQDLLRFEMLTPVEPPSQT